MDSYLIDILQPGHAMRAPDMRQRTQTGIFIQGGHPENHLCLTWALGQTSISFGTPKA